MHLSKTHLISMTALLLVGCGGGGGSSSGGNFTPPPVTADTTNPTLSISPTTATVESGGTVTVDISFSDNVGVTVGPTVTCTNGGSLTGNTFTAPTVTTQTDSVCTITVQDAAGNSASTSFTATVTPSADTTLPVVSFSPDALTVPSSGTGTSTLSASDNVGITSGPTVTCTNGGAFAGSTFTAPAVTVQTTSVCTATASDAAGNQGSAILTVTITPPSSGVTVSGSVTFDLVPFNTTTNGLDYNNITQSPARGITVQALDSAGTVLESTVTSNAGAYALSVPANTDVRIRARAELIQTSGATWDIRATDNTNNNAVYAIDGSLTNTGASNSVRNLNAASGWGGAGYTSTRAAAPFAILDPIYTTLKTFEAIDSDIVFPATQFRWSPQNRPVSGDVALGEISTSSYQRRAGEEVGNVFILGAENTDTDEYDRHVVVHEWGHYFEDALSRSDSIGGSHTLSARLDPRVAFGEGFANALSAIILEDTFYRDSSGNLQAQGFSINVENNTTTNPGWFNEDSVQTIIYDLFDASNEVAQDTLSLGLGPIYNTFVSDAYTQQDFFTTIFSFIDQLRVNAPGNDAAITTLVNSEQINGTGPDGAGETNSGNVPEALPLYNPITLNGPAVNVCSDDENGTNNRLGVREFLRIDLPRVQAYTFTMTRTSGPATTDPDFRVFQREGLFINAISGDPNVETSTRTLNSGIHLISAWDDANVSSSSTQQSCFDFTVTG